MTRVAIAPMSVLLLLAVLAVIVLIRVCWKRPSLGAGIALAILASFAAVFLFRSVSHQRIRHVEPATTGLKVIRNEDSAAIWLPGIEDGVGPANMYPSKLSAVRSLALRIGKPIRDLLGDQQWPARGILFQGGHDQELLDEFIKTAADEFPQTHWTTASETRGVQQDEIGIRLDLSGVKSSPAPWQDGSGSEATRGTFRASVMDGESQTSITADYVEKPWIENFFGVWNSRPNKRLIVAKSAQSCLTQAEANRQAIENARSQLTELLRQTSWARSTPSLPREVTANDVLEGDFIVDRFAQSLDGRASKIWRQALLIDASIERMEDLAQHKAAMARATRINWAKMIFSVAGLLALITVTYAFLNAATKGYYTWSLRIAGVVLAAAVIILFVA